MRRGPAHAPTVANARGRSISSSSSIRSRRRRTMKRPGLGPQVLLLWRGPEKQELQVQQQQQQQLGLGSRRYTITKADSQPDFVRSRLTSQGLINMLCGLPACVVVYLAPVLVHTALCKDRRESTREKQKEKDIPLRFPERAVRHQPPGLLLGRNTTSMRLPGKLPNLVRPTRPAKAPSHFPENALLASIPE